MKTSTDTRHPGDDASIPIGELSRRTGLSVLRIRAWEARHGVPEPLRTEGGQRRYSPQQALRLELLSQAVRAGHRIGELHELTDRELSALVPGASESIQEIDDPWMDAVHEGDEDRLHKLFEKTWRGEGWRAFIVEHATPFLSNLGGSWESGDIGVAQEHFASGILASFLEEKWRARNRRLTGRPLVLAILPDDLHAFGLHFTAIAATEAGRRVVWLGTQSPISSILAAVRGWDASGLAVSVPFTADSATHQILAGLRRELPPELSIYAGGAGIAGRLRGIHVFQSPGDFHDHISKLHRRH